MNDQEFTIENLTSKGVGCDLFAPDIADVLLNLPEPCSRRLIQAFQDLHNRKIIAEFNEKKIVFLSDRDSHDYLKGFYDGCKHTKR